MAEHYRFFNSSEGDIREYTAADFAEYFSRFLSDGLYSENGQVGLKVSPGNGMSVNVSKGYAYVRGYMYHNDDMLNKPLEPSDGLLDRIDRIVLRFDEVNRSISIIVKKGTLASNPVAPALEITETVKEMTLAQVRINKNAISISTSVIADERLSPLCGLVSSLITVPAKDMWDAWNQSLADISTVWQAWFSSVQNDLGKRVMTNKTEPTNKQPGDIWFRRL